MTRTARARLMDMEEAIAGIEAIVSRMNFALFSENREAQWAVERGLEIISEASRSIPAEHKQALPHVPWPRIAALGNFLRHEYQRVEPRLVWNIAHEHLPELAAAVVELKRQLTL